MNKYCFIILISINISLGKILINEVLPEGTNGDWIEFYVTPGDYSEYKIKEKTKVIKIFPKDFVFYKNSYFVLHINQENESKDETLENTGENNYLDLYSSDSGLVKTDNVIVIEDKNNKIIDALIYANQDNTWTGAKITYNEVIEQGEWKSDKIINGNDKEIETNAVDTAFLTENKSLGRINLSDTNTKEDWRQFTFLTPGKENILIPEEKGKAENNVNLNIFPNPFLPYNNSSVEIFFKLAFLAKVSIKIYNLDGRIIKTIIDAELDKGEYKYLWDGKNSRNQIVPMGVYVVYFKIFSLSCKIIKKKTIIVAKKLT